MHQRTYYCKWRSFCSPTVISKPSLPRYCLESTINSTSNVRRQRQLSTVRPVSSSRPRLASAPASCNASHSTPAPSVNASAIRPQVPFISTPALASRNAQPSQCQSDTTSSAEHVCSYSVVASTSSEWQENGCYSKERNRQMSDEIYSDLLLGPAYWWLVILVSADPVTYV